MAGILVELLDDIAAVFLGIEGINREAVYSAGGTKGRAAGVRDLPDNLSEGGSPAVVVLDGDRSIIPGGNERTTYAVEAGVWIPDITPRSEVWRTLLDLEDPIRDAFRDNDRAASANPAVQAVVITDISRVTNRQWNRAEQAPWFLVLPITFQVRVNLPVQYRQVPNH